MRDVTPAFITDKARLRGILALDGQTEANITADEWLTKNWLGVWGAGLSTLLAVLKVLEFRANPGRLRLELIWQPGDAGAAGHVQYSWSAATPALRVTNKGHRRIRVVEAGVLRSRRGEPAKAASSGFSGLPATLDEGESVTVSGGQFSDWILDQKVRAVFVRDSLGRDWRIGRTALKSFRQVSPPTDRA